MGLPPITRLEWCAGRRLRASERLNSNLILYESSSNDKTDCYTYLSLQVSRAEVCRSFLVRGNVEITSTARSKHAVYISSLDRHSLRVNATRILAPVSDRLCLYLSASLIVSSIPERKGSYQLPMYVQPTRVVELVSARTSPWEGCQLTECLFSVGTVIGIVELY